MGIFSKVAACAALVGCASACTVSDGTHTYDLSTIPFAGALNIKQVIAANPGLDGYYQWAVSLCNPVAPVYPKACAATPSAYVYEYPNGHDTCVASMNTPTAGWIWDAGKVAATRTFNGQGVRAVIDITCDAAANTLTVAGDAPTEKQGDTWVWNLKLKSMAVCGGGPGPNPTPSPGGHNTGGGSPKDEGGLGGGFWFLLILILAAVFYVGGVVLYNFVRLGKRGKELAPHPEFWTMLPGLFVDGIMFTKDGIMAGIAKVRGGGGGGSGGGYAEV